MMALPPTTYQHKNIPQHTTERTLTPCLFPRYDEAATVPLEIYNINGMLGDEEWNALGRQVRHSSCLYFCTSLLCFSMIHVHKCLCARR